MSPALRDGELETAVEMAEALRAGRVSSAELVERSIARAEVWQRSTVAFSQLWAQEAVDEARRLDADPPGVGPLAAGVPLAVKDLFDVAGHETTGCCRIYAGRVAADDAPTIARMRGASLVMIGKTNQHELALGGSNLFSACGRTGNPWDPARMTGGSSGGSAAAVAAGVVPWALGSDTGGSIRIPSSLCGTFGLKPTTGRLPTGGMLPLAPSLDTPGPVAATGEDLRLLYRILAGGPLEDAGAGAGAGAGASASASARAGAGAGAGAGPSPRLRLGKMGGYFAENVHPEVAAGVEAVAAALEGTGAVVEPVDGSGLDGSRAVWARVCYPEFVLAHPLLRDRLDEVLDPAIVEAVNLATRLTPAERAAAVERRAEIGRWFRRRLAGFDALIVPTTGYAAPAPWRTAFELGGDRRIDLARVGPGWFTCPVNLAGLPAVSMPAGRSAEGLPFGVSLIGAEDAEETLLSIALTWEVVTGYQPARPPLPS